MICDICHKKEAVIFVEQTSKNEVKKIHLCADCAAERGISTMMGEEMGKSLNAIFKELAKHIKNVPDKACPVCGLHLSKFKVTGQLGCPECYSIFKDEISEYMQSHGIKGQYSGSMPRRLSSFRSILTDRADVQVKLEKAIEKEDYEKAAFYRDYLKAIEKHAVATVSDDEVEDGNEQK